MTETLVDILEQARQAIHAAVAAPTGSERRRCEAHHATSLAATALADPDATDLHKDRAGYYIEEAAWPRRASPASRPTIRKRLRRYRYPPACGRTCRIGDNRPMAFPPESDEGQPGLVLLPDGRTAYRFKDSDDLIIMKRGPEATTSDV